MIFIVLGGLVLKIWPLLGVFHFATHFLHRPPLYFELPPRETELRSQIRRIS